MPPRWQSFSWYNLFEAHFVKKCASVIFAFRRVILLRSDMMHCIVILPSDSFQENIIPLKPQGFNITFAMRQKFLQTIVCNITLPLFKIGRRSIESNRFLSANFPCHLEGSLGIRQYSYVAHFAARKIFYLKTARWHLKRDVFVTVL